MSILSQVAVGLLTAAVQALVVTLFVKRMIAKRDADRWMPFRRYLLQVLYDESFNEMEAANKLSQELKARLDALNTLESWPSTLDEMIAVAKRAAVTLKESRRAIHQAIQTAAPSLTSEAAANFTNIFRALDNGPILLEGLARKLGQLALLGRPDPDQLEARVSEAQSAVSVEGIKLLGGVSYLVKDVESLLEQHGYVVVEGLVSTPEDVRRRRHAEAIAEEARKRFAEQGAGQ